MVSLGFASGSLSVSSDDVTIVSHSIHHSTGGPLALCQSNLTGEETNSSIDDLSHDMTLLIRHSKCL